MTAESKKVEQQEDKLEKLFEEFGGDPRSLASASEEELKKAQKRVYGERTKKKNRPTKASGSWNGSPGKFGPLGWGR